MSQETCGIRPHVDHGYWVQHVPRAQNVLADELSKKAVIKASAHWNLLSDSHSLRHIFGCWDGDWIRESGVAGCGAFLWANRDRPNGELDASMHLLGFVAIKCIARSAQQSECVAYILLHSLLSTRLKDSLQFTLDPTLCLGDGGRLDRLPNPMIEVWSAGLFCILYLLLLACDPCGPQR